jgi:hypothetical protein
MTEPVWPNLFIVGAPKSGTTSLFEYLSGHPQVYMSPVKEPLYFCPDVRITRRPRLEFGRDEARYLELFAGAGTAKVVGEASTRYLASPQAPGLVHDIAPGASIVVALRHPVEMIHALHNERVSNTNEDILDFEQALAADDDRRAGRRLPPGSNELGAVYRDNGRYAQHLERWLAVFGKERVHVIVFDDFVADTPGVFRDLLTFLDISADHMPASFAVHNPSHRQRRSVRALADSRLGRLLTTRLLPVLIGERRRAGLAKRFRRSSVSRRDVTREPVPPHVRSALESELAPDVARLSNLLGRDLGQLWFGRPSFGALTREP